MFIAIKPCLWDSEVSYTLKIIPYDKVIVYPTVAMTTYYNKNTKK